MCRIRLNDEIMFSYENSYDFVGLRAENPGLQGLVQCSQG